MNSQHLGPVIIEGERIVQLQREALGIGKFPEARIQALVHAAPSIIPMHEIEPAYSDMMSLCVELPLSSGLLDNLWITPLGGVVIGECKLFRNPQARREVIAQALDYAQALQRLSYESFEKAIAVARKESDFRLHDFVSRGLPESEALPEAMFIDGVSRRLRAAQIMILIIGDGIREELEDLSDFLQLHAGIHANLALVDLSLWRMPDGRSLVIPRLPLKTATVVRGVVRVEPSEATGHIVVSEEDPIMVASGPRQSTRPVPKSGSAEEFLQLLESGDPASAEVVSRLVALLPETAVEVRYSPQYVIFEVPVGDRCRTVLDVKYDGYIWGGSLLYDEPDPVLNEMLRRALHSVAASMPAVVSFTDRGSHRFRKADGTRLRASDLAGREEAIIGALLSLATVARDAASEASGTEVQ